MHLIVITSHWVFTAGKRGKKRAATVNPAWIKSQNRHRRRRRRKTSRKSKSDGYFDCIPYLWYNHQFVARCRSAICLFKRPISPITERCFVFFILLNAKEMVNKWNYIDIVTNIRHMIKKRTETTEKTHDEHTVHVIAGDVSYGLVICWDFIEPKQNDTNFLIWHANCVDLLNSQTLEHTSWYCWKNITLIE